MPVRSPNRSLPTRLGAALLLLLGLVGLAVAVTAPGPAPPPAPPAPPPRPRVIRSRPRPHRRPVFPTATAGGYQRSLLRRASTSRAAAPGVKGFDCMSLVQYAVYQVTGIALPGDGSQPRGVGHRHRPAGDHRPGHGRPAAGRRRLLGRQRARLLRPLGGLRRQRQCLGRHRRRSARAVAHHEPTWRPSTPTTAPCGSGRRTARPRRPPPAGW